MCFVIIPAGATDRDVRSPQLGERSILRTNANVRLKHT